MTQVTDVIRCDSERQIIIFTMLLYKVTDAVIKGER